MMSLGQRSQGTLVSVPAPRPLAPFDLKNPRSTPCTSRHWTGSTLVEMSHLSGGGRCPS